MAIPKDSLTVDEIKNLNKDGYKLDESKTYVIRFGFNDKLNEAADPAPFQVDTSILDKMANDMIGMPWIVVPKKMHLRGSDEGLKDNAKSLLEIQNKYSVGEIAAYIKSDANNVWPIIEIWPEWVDAVEQRTIPNLVSPTFNVIKQNGSRILDAEFLNLQSVGSSGYPAQLTQIQGVCKNGIKECMDELRVYAASGKLGEARKNPELFSNTLSRVVGAMSDAANAIPPTENGAVTDAAIKSPEAKAIVAKIEEVKTEIVKVEEEVTAVKEEVTAVKEEVTEVKQMETKIIEAVEEVAVQAEGVDETQIKKTLEEAVNPPSTTPPVNGIAPIGAAKGQELELPKELANHPYLKQLQKTVKTSQAELETIKRERADEKKAIDDRRRKSEAESIVSILIEQNKIKTEDKVKKVQEYLELKDEKGELKDLGLVEATLKSLYTNDKKVSESGKVEGAYGNESTIPDFSTEDEPEKPTPLEIAQKMSKRN